MSKRIFISYDYDNDKHYKNLLVAWDRNGQFDFKFKDHSADISINSTSAPTIKAALSRFINEANIFLVLVGEKTTQSDWVDWEINKAVELKKKIVAVKIDRSYSTPLSLYGVGANWAMSFTFDSIVNAINS